MLKVNKYIYINMYYISFKIKSIPGGGKTIALLCFHLTVSGELWRCTTSPDRKILFMNQWWET